MRFLAVFPLVGLLLAGCATPQNRYDPLEPVNRKVYAFNRAVDTAIVRPVAQAYTDLTPSPLQIAVRNFFGNLEDLYISANNLLQGKWQEAGSDAGRFIFNSTLGLVGFIDLATPMGMPKHNEDFGQTLGVWGVESGPYLVVPVFGSKTLRDTSDWVVGTLMDPIYYLENDSASLGGQALRLIDTRVKLLPSDAVVEAAGPLDEYAFVRDGYLQRRHSLIFDGKPKAPLPLGDDNENYDVRSLIIRE